MQQLSVTSSGKNNKSCRIFHIETKKLGLHFSEFSTIFYAIYKILQNSNTIGDPLLHRGPWNFSAIHKYALGSHLGPWNYSRPRNWVPGTNGGDGSPESGGAGGVFGLGKVWRRCRAHLNSVCGQGKERGGSREGARRRPAAVAAGAGAPASRPARSGHEEHGEFRWCKGEEPRVLLGYTSAWKGRLGYGGMPGGAATACARRHDERLYSQGARRGGGFVAKVADINVVCTTTGLGRRARQMDADGPMGPTRHGPASVAGFEMPRWARGMGKERPGGAVRGSERQGAGTSTLQQGADVHGAAQARRDAASASPHSVNVPCFERVKLQKVA
jgi:hypothetical protein